MRDRPTTRRPSARLSHLLQMTERPLRPTLYPLTKHGIHSTSLLPCDRGRDELGGSKLLTIHATPAFDNETRGGTLAELRLRSREARRAQCTSDRVSCRKLRVGLLPTPIPSGYSPEGAPDLILAVLAALRSVDITRIPYPVPFLSRRTYRAKTRSQMCMMLSRPESEAMRTGAPQ
ncbi:hypothetical protein GY45DRAFT_650152 [Cubamyces sp. BRFM 1775]|nr:hypothetical protein GY45DRAFT_650152 [Cubamyces sp. BRFM 1775]